MLSRRLKALKFKNSKVCFALCKTLEGNFSQSSNFEVLLNTQDGTELTLRTASKHNIRFFERWILNGFF